ncbi:MAG: hypothetical protein CENE_00331 [Candidatus Celerinatantimonas neptuna]|nr:MAG: hypothetical protein CENE_00331 [Candidatus Celerinatantimonas neptuna]
MTIEHIRQEDIQHIHDEKEVDEYPLPDFGQPDHHSSTNAFEHRWYKDNQPQAPEAGDEPELKPLTIDDIEKIRQAAYEEGFAEGREAGYQKGLSQGHEEGSTKGREEGVQQGLKEGLEQGQSQIETLSGYWRKLIDELENPVLQFTEHVQLQLVDLVIQIARAVIRCEVTTNKQVVIETVKEAIQAMPVVKQTLQIHLHPDDMLVIEAVYPPETQQKKGWQLLADGSLSRGDCVIETDNSAIELSMEDIIEQSLKRFRSENFQAARKVTPPERPQEIVDTAPFEAQKEISETDIADEQSDDQSIDFVADGHEENIESDVMPSEHSEQIESDDGTLSNPE